MAVSQTPRRRRAPAEARREILEAAAGLLRDQPFHTLSVEAIMRETTLSRKSFYVYFSGRYDLLVAMFEPLAEQFGHSHATFLESSGNLIEDGRIALRGVAGLFENHGWLLRALADARDYDADARRLWDEIHEPLFAAFAEKIRAEVGAGRMHVADPGLTARALLSMDIHLFLDTLARDPEADLVALADGLLAIWSRALLLRDP